LLPTSDYLKKGPIRRLEGEGQFATILAAPTQSSGAQQCDSMASHQQKFECQAEERALPGEGRRSEKVKYKDLVMIAEKKFGMIHLSISLSDSQITRMVKKRQII